jgi:hypothetical protein
VIREIRNSVFSVSVFRNLDLSRETIGTATGKWAFYKNVTAVRSVKLLAISGLISDAIKD